MNVDDLKKLNGWHRAGIAASLLWTILATTTYSMSLGSHYVNERALADLLPAIVLAWWRFSYKSGLGLFEITNSSDFKFTTLSFDFVGYLGYVLIPIAALWLCGYLVAWVVAGFHKR
jgi:hypothetical protein